MKESFDTDFEYDEWYEEERWKEVHKDCFEINDERKFKNG